MASHRGPPLAPLQAGRAALWIWLSSPQRVRGRVPSSTWGVIAEGIPHINQAAKASSLMQPDGPAFFLDLESISKRESRVQAASCVAAFFKHNRKDGARASCGAGKTRSSTAQARRWLRPVDMPVLHCATVCAVCRVRGLVQQGWGSRCGHRELPHGAANQQPGSRAAALTATR